MGDIKVVYWISKIELSKDREENIRDCFLYQSVNFDCPNSVEEFDDLLEIYRQKKADYTENDLGENMILDKLIVMEHVSGLADRLKEFANFLTVSRKYGLTCVYIFNTIYPIRKNWQMIMSQTKIFNFFPESVHASSVIKFCSSFASRDKNTSHTKIFGLINFEISNSRQKQCLTIDTRDVNAKFRT